MFPLKFERENKACLISCEVQSIYPPSNEIMWEQFNREAISVSIFVDMIEPLGPKMTNEETLKECEIKLYCEALYVFI